VAASFIGLPLVVAKAQEVVDPDAKSVLEAMSGYLAGLEAFSADYEADFDVVTSDGQKLKFASSGNLIVKRPGQLHITRTGTIADVDFVLDDGLLTIHGRGINGYVQLPAATIDDAIDVVRDDIGFEAPGADLLSAAPLNPDVTDLVSGTHVGMTDIGGVSVHHLAFRGDQVDWQLWVKEGDEPLPIRYVITSKWMTGAPEYSLQLSNWNTAPSIGPEAFAFTPPAGAKKLSGIAVDETGQLVAAWE
jgi:hypothetical protein